MANDDEGTSPFQGQGVMASHPTEAGRMPVLGGRATESDSQHFTAQCGSWQPRTLLLCALTDTENHSLVTLATFQCLGGHMWLVVAILDSPQLKAFLSSQKVLLDNMVLGV